MKKIGLSFKWLSTVPFLSLMHPPDSLFLHRCYSFDRYPALLRGDRLLALVYFGSFCILILYLVLNVVLAATYNGWKQQHTKKLLDLRVRRYQNLLIAWQILVVGSSQPQQEPQEPQEPEAPQGQG